MDGCYDNSSVIRFLFGCCADFLLGLGFTPEIWVVSFPDIVINYEGPHCLVTITFSFPDSFTSYCFLVTSLKTWGCYGSSPLCANSHLLALALRPRYVFVFHLFLATFVGVLPHYLGLGTLPYYRSLLGWCEPRCSLGLALMDSLGVSSPSPII